MKLSQIPRTDCQTSEQWYERANEVRAEGKELLRQATEVYKYDEGRGLWVGNYREAQRLHDSGRWALDVADDMEMHATTPRGTPADYKPRTLISIKRALPSYRQTVSVNYRGAGGRWFDAWLPGFNFWQPFLGESFGRSGIEWWMPDNASNSNEASK